jgi:hypothetical protein
VFFSLQCPLIDNSQEEFFMKLLKLVPVLALVLFAVSCAPSIPQKDVDAAAAALADAKTAQADVFAADAYKAATDADAALQANLTAKEYGKTAELAKAVVDAATAAKTAAAAGAEAAKADVAKLVTDVPAAAELVKKELDKAVKAGKKAKLDVTKAQADFQTASAALKAGQDAATANNIGEAKTQLTAAAAGFDALKTALEGAGFKA